MRMGCKGGPLCQLCTCSWRCDVFSVQENEIMENATLKLALYRMCLLSMSFCLCATCGFMSGWVKRVSVSSSRVAWAWAKEQRNDADESWRQNGDVRIPIQSIFSDMALRYCRPMSRNAHPICNRKYRTGFRWFSRVPIYPHMSSLHNASHRSLLTVSKRYPPIMHVLYNSRTCTTRPCVSHVKWHM